MREATGSTWVFQLVLIFILIFASYLTISINYTKTFKLKNEVLSIIERSEGLTEGNTGAIGIINNYLVGQSYNGKGVCEAGYYGATTLTGNNMNTDFEFIDGNSNKKYYYCVKKVSGYYSAKPKRSYYRIVLFVDFELPVIGRISTFRAEGQTSEIEVTYDNLFTVQY